MIFLPRRINIGGRDALVKSLSRKEKREKGFRPRSRIVQRTSERLNEKYSAAMMLAHLFFPRNFPILLASGRDRKTTYSRRVFLDKKSQEAIDSFYENESANGKRPELKARFERYGSEISERVEKTLNRILNETGIGVNYQPMNVGIRKEKLVFFEVWDIHLATLRKKINSMRRSRKKSQAIELLRIIEKDLPLNTRTVHVHRKGEIEPWSEVASRLDREY